MRLPFEAVRGLENPHSVSSVSQPGRQCRTRRIMASVIKATDWVAKRHAEMMDSSDLESSDAQQVQTATRVGGGQAFPGLLE